LRDEIKRIKWAGCVERMRREEVYKGFWWEILKERVYIEGLGIVGSIILKLIFKTWIGSIN
jgi:hypothetical protein